MSRFAKSEAAAAGSPLGEAELVSEFANIQSEEELDRFIPLLLPAIKMAAPLLMKAAGPLLKTVAGGLLGGGGNASPRRRSRRQGELEDEQFLGKILGGLFGETEAESEEEEQFIGKILSGLLGETEAETEDEQYFLGRILGGLFGGKKDREVQEHFIGGLLGKLFGGRELEFEGNAEAFDYQARRFIRLARIASHSAGVELAALIRTGHRPHATTIQRIVLRTFVRTANRLGRGAPARPLVGEVSRRTLPKVASGDHKGRWVRHGDRLVIEL